MRFISRRHSAGAFISPHAAFASCMVCPSLRFIAFASSAPVWRTLIEKAALERSGGKPILHRPYKRAPRPQGGLLENKLPRTSRHRWRTRNQRRDVWIFVSDDDYSRFRGTCLLVRKYPPHAHDTVPRHVPFNALGCSFLDPLCDLILLGLVEAFTALLIKLAVRDFLFTQSLCHPSRSVSLQALPFGFL